MNATKRTFLYFLSATLGGLLGFGISKLLEAKDDELVQISGEGYIQPEIPGIQDEIPEEILPLVSEKNKEKEQELKVDYHRRFVKSKPTNKVAEEATKVGDGYPEVEKTSVHIISFDKWMEDDPDYEKVVLTYYDKDDILLSESGTIISQNVHQESIGEDALLNFGKDSNDPYIVYVRNEDEHTDYEIVRVNGSYSEIVLGIREEPELKKNKSKKSKPKPAGGQLIEDD